MNSVPPKAAAKHGLLYNKPASGTGSLNKSLRLAASLSVANFIMIYVTILNTPCYAT
jgi:hypothetical protein